MENGEWARNLPCKPLGLGAGPRKIADPSSRGRRVLFLCRATAVLNPRALA